MNHESSPLSSAELIRLAELAEKLRDNSIADEEVAELENLIAGSPEARRWFTDLAMLTAELEHVQGRIILPRTSPKRESISAILGRFWASIQSWQSPLVLAAAAAVLMTFVGWQWVLPQFARHEVIASICKTSGAVLWENRHAVKSDVGEPLTVGAYELRQGIMEFTYTNGIQILIESPAKFELCGTELLKLKTGKLSAHVPHNAIGFKVTSPSATIVDLGTEFGVKADSEQSEVHVFDGKVRVETPNINGPQLLTEHCASRVDTATGTPAGINYQPQMFLQNLTQAGSPFALAIKSLNPMAYYPMRVMPDIRVLKDEATGHHDGKINLGSSTTPWAQGRVDIAMQLGGPKVGAYAGVFDWPIITNGTLSVCAWVKASSRTRWASIAKNWAINEETNLGGQFHFGLHDDDGALEVHVNDKDLKQIAVRDQEPFPIDAWQFVAFTFDGKTLRLYRNGREVGATPCASLTTHAPRILGIGVKLDGTGRQPDIHNPGIWDGRIDDLAVFNYALSVEQIQQLFNTLNVPAANSPRSSFSKN